MDLSLIFQQTKKVFTQPAQETGLPLKIAPKVGLDGTWAPILTPRPFYPNFRGSGPTWSVCPTPTWPKRVKKGPTWPKMAQNDQKWPPKGVWTPLWPSRPANFHSPSHFTPTLGGLDPLGAFASHPNAQEESKKAQKGPKWLKMTKNGPERGYRRHLGPRDRPILVGRSILPLD